MMKNILSALAGVSLAALATSAHSAAVVINFDAVTRGAFVNSFYSGGTDSLGATGPNLGVAFQAGGWIADIGFGVSPPQFAYLAEGGARYVNVAAGFTNSIAFSYGAFNSDTIINVYDGLSGSGTLLSSIGAPANNVNSFSSLSLSFAGVGRSVVVVGNGQNFGWDNLQLGAVPESGTWMMMIVGFGATGTALRYRRRKANVTFANDGRPSQQPT